jgi:glyoxylase-like metal-dependent hydrolase (beta-lactamase superfamily II)
MGEAPPKRIAPGRWLVSFLIVLIFAVVLLVHRSGPAPVDSLHPVPDSNKVSDSLPHVLSPKAVTIVPGIHLLGGLKPAAAYVVETSAGLVLIDAGLHAFLVKREMGSLGLNWEQVRAIFLTHVHGDHSGGAQELRSAVGAKIYAGEGDTAILRAGAPREAFFSKFPMPDPTPGPTTVDVVLKGGETITIGEARFQVLTAAGHTPGSVCYLLEHRGRRALFSGDVILSLLGSEDSTGRSDRLGTYAAYLAPRFRGNAGAFLSTLRQLRSLAVPDLVLPGHPRNDRVPQSPVMDGRRWRLLLDSGIREMEQLQARFLRDGANFLEGDARQLLPGLYYLGDFKKAAVYGLFAPSGFYVVGAPGPGLGEFVVSRLAKLGLKPATPRAVLLTSGSTAEIGGLTELVEKYRCQVVASRDACQLLRTSCPAGTRFLPADELPRQGWFDVQVLPLAGCGVAPVGYLVGWQGKSVLFSGRIPIKPEPTREDISKAHLNPNDYRESLFKLAELKPDLWLPAFPADGQNANLYDLEWGEVIMRNLAATDPNR